MAQEKPNNSAVTGKEPESRDPVDTLAPKPGLHNSAQQANSPTEIASLAGTYRSQSHTDAAYMFPMSGIRSRVSQGGSSYGLLSHWSVSWSDIMMVMFVMFAVLFAMQLTERDVQELFHEEQDTATETKMKPEREIEKTETGELTPAELADLPMPIEEILQLSEQLVADANLENIDVVLTDKQAVKVSVRGPLLFDLGKADLKPEAIEFLEQLAEIIARNNYEIQVVGHTDNFPISTPDFPTNWELSAVRATRVARYLIRAGRFEPGRVTVIGHALYRPMVPNTSLANKARNRRVEIIITRNEYQP
ncbi:MAG: flagellar motor protein MotB [Gammaproteobacteria bacterium]